jgi:ABC-type Fe3+/spermidine/putrescine transport system ATPase subunit
MNHGRLEQVAAPADLYERPASRFVADFIGQVNLFEGRMLEWAGGVALVAAPELSQPVSLPAPSVVDPGAAVWIAVRPEAIALSPRGDGALAPPAREARATAPLPAVIRSATYLGVASTFDAELPGGRLVRAQRPNRGRRDEPPLRPGDPVWLSWAPGAPCLLLS